jgi:predicted dehydrogenase
VGQYIEDHAGHGPSIWVRQIHGSRGMLSLPVDRTGAQITLHRVGQDDITGEALLELVPEFRLDEVTGTLFGGERLAGYTLPFAEVDRKLLGIEYADFAAAIRGEHPPEVDVEQGARSVAIAYALLESSAAGRLVTVDEVLDERADAYQRSIDAGMGLV